MDSVHEGFKPFNLFSKCMDISSTMDDRDKKLLQLRIGLCLVRILEERKKKAATARQRGRKDHRAIDSLRKLAAASGVDYGSVQKISKGDQGMEVFTLMDILEALDLDLASFGQQLNQLTRSEVIQYEAGILRSRRKSG